MTKVVYNSVINTKTDVNDMNNMNNRQMRPSRQSNVPAGSYTSNFTIICVIFICVLLLANFKIFSSIITGNPEIITTPVAISEEKRVEDSKTESEKALEADIKNNFARVNVSFDDTKAGNLILVGNNNAFDFNSSPRAVVKHPLVSIFSKKNDNYVVSYNTETMTSEAILAFNALTEDFKAATGISDLIILDSYRSYEDQERVYANKGGDIATVPGHSEHHTGLAFDLSLYRSGIVHDFDGSGDYEWIFRNCHKYGYVLRYPADKTEITGISYEPWHYRYVGKEHAYYMYTNNLCLEEYISILENYPINSGRLHVETDSGEKYMIYSVAVSEGGDEIPVPNNYEYTLSGDNNGHVIVSAVITE